MTIRIVPPHPAALIGEAPPSTAAAQLTYRGGPLLASAQVTGVFLGDWTMAAMQPIDAFLKAIVPSHYLDALAEYNVGHGSYGGSVALPWIAGPPPPPPPPPPPSPQPGGCLPTFGLARLVRPQELTQTATNPTTIDDSEIQTRLSAAIASGTLPAKTPQSLYMVFVQSGVMVTMQGQNSCSSFCGYHDATSDGLYYGVIPYPNCAGCTGTLAAFDALTSITTHELAEAVTDPVPGTGWYDDANGEIGDICAWQNDSLDGYVVQKEFSNRSSACI